MNIKPMLDRWEIKGIEKISTDEIRDLREHEIPGLDGSLFQNAGAVPTHIRISGSLYADDVKENFLRKLREKFRAGKPLNFSADITTATEVKQVIIEDLFFKEVAQNPEQLHYSITLKEHLPDPQPQQKQALNNLTQQIEDAAGSFLDNIELGIQLAEQLSRFIPILEKIHEQLKKGPQIFFPSID